DADAISTPLRARAPRAGDRMRPFGLAGHKKLSDLFVDRKIPRRRRERAIVVEGETIHWVPGLATSEEGRVGPTTARVVRLKATPR
ncbi:MAG: tRNA lysidine(34) synthetase TilS, partial [Candidatus Latescibacteria bacterium]|nr:tRNA lysidine(34) synthetase TilS [Candidatus Latescibacterota bacterium]